jgi:hypothetical protein
MLNAARLEVRAGAEVRRGTGAGAEPRGRVEDDEEDEPRGRDADADETAPSGRRLTLVVELAALAFALGS